MVGIGLSEVTCNLARFEVRRQGGSLPSLEPIAGLVRFRRALDVGRDLRRGKCKLNLNGEPKFRRLEPYWRMAETAGRTSSSGVSGRR